ncbi:disintegrin and metalloproteinase domain-containing protein 2 precursor [Oryctolagus cuniculus]|uniref:Disintegrin and metalloproteinase domain-containing protein 2 n=1 Tax=Oryctolagus cuniculus TaxID=9986 RepID=ADAM2_RABIT|nr:disintegrin and metalloproteinase domain-containing protein 2 precursor [Oryctolagus cuniculus]Q28660.1 RecName: Full=Disintegrin and metalloproteinase domain-containing protein 2; Short=ADAM 2; AltName: Full=Fertilin subunit beta; AltName: Full=PH-30; Short=PH30; AltName: Full=PH30-beta; Flags: Precursor [Oryctolagus cuniculus]AAA93321.1 fertilin beta subunit [Oryctolagus cuniculus]
MLRVLFLLCGLSGLRTKENSERLHVQVTVPEKMRSVTSEGFETEVVYNIVIEGKTYTLNLMQKLFLPRDFRVYGYDSTGIMKDLEQQFQNFCYYQGFVEGYPNSMVIVSTCTGLRGLLQFENVTYGIEPLESSIGFEHVIYQVKNKNESISLYAEKEVEFRDLPYKVQSVQPREFSQYIEMHVVVEKNLYKHMGSDTAVVSQKIFQLIGLTNAVFTSFNITIILSSLELWIDENKISTTGDANELLYRFLKWKKSYLVLRPHDVAFLLVYREIAKYVGATFQGKMCDINYSGGVALHPKTISLESLAIILAQLLSLSMGIAYDDINKCKCPGSVCIMNPEAIHSSGVKIFSNCSIEDFSRFISKQKSQCLQNLPRLEPFYKQDAVCGNSIVEAGEMCDCGTAEECGRAVPICCNSATCRLEVGSQCAEGECCENCTFKERGQSCRPPVGECDLFEYCNGTSALCPDDIVIQNGHPCGENQWICVDGSCISPPEQCKSIFGEEVEGGTPECYEELNAMADIILGICGITHDGYKKCESGNRKCGKLMCKHTTENIIDIKNATIIYANVSGSICLSLEYKPDHLDAAKMWVPNGAVCGSNKICRDKACVETTYVNLGCTLQNCNNQGICNSLQHCHCNPTFLPPNCSAVDERWAGGSVDSGNFQGGGVPGIGGLTSVGTPPFIPGVPGVRRYMEDVYQTAKPTRWPFFLLIPFFIILGALIAILVKVQFQRKKWKTEDYTSDEQFESDSELKE